MAIDIGKVAQVPAEGRHPPMIKGFIYIAGVGAGAEYFSHPGGTATRSAGDKYGAVIFAGCSVDDPREQYVLHPDFVQLEFYQDT